MIHLCAAEYLIKKTFFLLTKSVFFLYYKTQSECPSVTAATEVVTMEMSKEADQGSMSDDLKEPLNVTDTFWATALSLKCFFT